MKIKNKTKLLLLVPPTLFLVGCVTDRQVETQIAKVLDEHPEILFDVIEKKPEQFMDVAQKAAIKKRQARLRQQKKQEELALQEAIDKPLTPMYRSDEAIRGVKGAPIKIVEYSDFQCPYCQRGTETIKQFMEKYKGKVQFVYKHIPMSFHPQALITAKYYEGLRIQNKDWAFQFHDEVFKNQSRLKVGERYLRGVAKKLGADLKQLEIDIMSEAVAQRIAQDQKEAEKFGFSGTPSFVVNGVPIVGAQPLEKFESVIKVLKEKSKLKI